MVQSARLDQKSGTEMGNVGKASLEVNESRLHVKELLSSATPLRLFGGGVQRG